MKYSLLLIGTLLLAGCSTVHPNIPEGRNTDGAKVYTLHGHSMEPLIMDGAKVYVDVAYPFAALKAGDVVAYRNDKAKEGCTTHMLYDRCTHDGSWRTYGVNNLSIDSWTMDESEYIGLVIKVEQ